MSNAREIADLGTLFDASNNLTTSGTVTADAIVPNGNVTFTTGDRVIGNGDEKIKFDSTNQDIEIQTADSVAMLIDSAQRVIIGHNANINNYDVQISTTSTAVFSSTCYQNTSSGSTQRLGKSRGATIDSNVLTVDGDQIGTIQFSGNDGNGFHTVAQIQCLQDGTTGNNDLPGALRFQTTADGASSPAERMRIDSSGNVGIGTSSPSDKLHVNGGSLRLQGAGDGAYATAYASGGDLFLDSDPANTGGSSSMRFGVDGTERMRINATGNLLVGKTGADTDTQGHEINGNNGAIAAVRTNDLPLVVNRLGNDGILVLFQQAGSSEGTIEVSGTTVTYNGGHLGRWSRLADNTKDTSIVKGTVMTNLDEMVVWSHETTYWTEDDELPVDEDANPTVAVGDVKKEAYTEDNEQLNKMAVSSVEGDSNVSGVFVKWDEEDGFNDFTIAMTGDMVIRIAQGTTVARGDLLMSAGDGTAKPQGDDIVRSKTIAKVTSTHVSHTYDDGSYLVPCVLMAC